MKGSLATQKEWRKGPWIGEEDKLLCEYVSLHGEGDLMVVIWLLVF